MIISILVIYQFFEIITGNDNLRKRDRLIDFTMACIFNIRLKIAKVKLDNFMTLTVLKNVILNNHENNLNDFEDLK